MSCMIDGEVVGMESITIPAIIAQNAGKTVYLLNLRNGMLSSIERPMQWSTPK